MNRRWRLGGRALLDRRRRQPLPWRRVLRGDRPPPFDRWKHEVNVAAGSPSWRAAWRSCRRRRGRRALVAARDAGCGLPGEHPHGAAAREVPEVRPRCCGRACRCRACSPGSPGAGPSSQGASRCFARGRRAALPPGSIPRAPAAGSRAGHPGCRARRLSPPSCTLGGDPGGMPVPGCRARARRARPGLRRPLLDSAARRSKSRVEHGHVSAAEVDLVGARLGGEPCAPPRRTVARRALRAARRRLRARSAPPRARRRREAARS